MEYSRYYGQPKRLWVKRPNPSYPARAVVSRFPQGQWFWYSCSNSNNFCLRNRSVFFFKETPMRAVERLDKKKNFLKRIQEIRGHCVWNVPRLRNASIRAIIQTKSEEHFQSAWRAKPFSHTSKTKKKLGKGLSNGFGWAPSANLSGFSVHRVMCDDAIRQGAQRNPEEDTFKQQPCKDIKIGLIKTIYASKQVCGKDEIGNPGRSRKGRGVAVLTRERVRRSLHVWCIQNKREKTRRRH